MKWKGFDKMDNIFATSGIMGLNILFCQSSEIK